MYNLNYCNLNYNMARIFTVTNFFQPDLLRALKRPANYKTLDEYY